MTACLRRWMYLDHNGLESLHNQSAGMRVIEQSKTASKSLNKSFRGTGSIGGLGAKLDVGSEFASGNRYDIFEKTAPGDERLLLNLEAYLAASGQLEQISSVRSVAEIYAKGESQFVTGILTFRWAATFDPDPVIDATRKEMIEFELDRESHDEAGMLAVPMRMGGSLDKCVDRKDLKDGSLSPTSHLATFLRQLATNNLRLGFFAQLQPMPGLIWLKPYAIWFP